MKKIIGFLFTFLKTYNLKVPARLTAQVGETEYLFAINKEFSFKELEDCLQSTRKVDSTVNWEIYNRGFMAFFNSSKNFKSDELSPIEDGNCTFVGQGSYVHIFMKGKDNQPLKLMTWVSLVVQY